MRFIFIIYLQMRDRFIFIIYLEIDERYIRFYKYSNDMK